MSTASINFGASAKNLTLTEIISKARDDKAGGSQHLRFKTGVGLHTHAKYEFSKTDLFAKFGDSKAIADRDSMRHDGAKQLKQSIDKEFGIGMGEKVFTHLGIDAEKGVTISQLSDLRDAAIRTRDMENNFALSQLPDHDLSQAFVKARDNIGVDTSGWSRERMAFVKERIIEAVVFIGPDATEQQINRAVDLVMWTEEFVDIAAEAQNKPMTESQAYNYHEAMRQFMGPAGKSSAASNDLIELTLLPIAQRFGAPMPDSINISVARELLKEQPIGEQLTAMKDFISGETKKAIQFGSGAIKAFLRGSPTTQGEAGFASYIQIKHQGGKYFRDQINTAFVELKKLPTFEYRDSVLTRATQDPEARLKTATDSINVFNGTMTALLGGQSDEDITKAVNSLPKEFCDLLATAHHALKTEMDKSPSLTLEEREHMTRCLNTNLFALRVVNPLMSDLSNGDGPTTKKVTVLQKLIQNAANDIPPSGEKEKALGGIEEELIKASSDWTKAIDLFMQKATARGTAMT